MSAEQTEALVLRVIPWSETSLIVNLFTRDFGKLSMVAKGARRPKSPFEAALDLLSICRVVFIAKSGDALDILTEAKLKKRFRAGSGNLLRLYAGYYVIELIDRLTDKGDSQPQVFELAVDSLALMDEPSIDIAAVVLMFEMQMLRLTGHLPSWRKCVRCGLVPPIGERGTLAFGMLESGVLCSTCQVGVRRVARLSAETLAEFERFSDNDWRKIDVSILSPRCRSAIRGVMNGYLTAMLDRKLQMHPYLEELGR